MPKKIIYQEASKTSWYGNFEDNENFPGVEKINMACMQRIALSLEKIALDKTELERSLDYYKEQYKSRLKEIEGLRNTNRALKAHITKLKNKYECNQP